MSMSKVTCVNVIGHMGQDRSSRGSKVMILAGSLKSMSSCSIYFMIFYFTSGFFGMNVPWLSGQTPRMGLRSKWSISEFLLPPALAEEVIFSVASVCACVCV